MSSACLVDERKSTYIVLKYAEIACSLGGLNASVLLTEYIPIRFKFESSCGAALPAAQVGGNVVG